MAKRDEIIFTADEVNFALLMVAQLDTDRYHASRAKALIYKAKTWQETGSSGVIRG